MSTAERVHGNDHPIVVLTDANFEEMILRSPVPVLVAFCSSRCGPSQRLGSSLHSVAETFGDSARIGRFEMDGRSTTPTDYGVQATPTLLFFRGGKAVARAVGAAPEEWLRRKLDDQIRSES